MADVYIFTDEGDEHLKEEVDDAGGGEEPANLSHVDRSATSKSYKFSSFSTSASTDINDIGSHVVHMARPEDFTSTTSSSEDPHRLESSSSSLMSDLGGGGLDSGSNRMHDDDDDPTTEEDEDDEEANMDPLARLLKWADSHNFYDKQMVARTLHETLRYALDSPEDVATVLDVMGSLSSNDDPILRTELMEQVPQIAFLAHDHPDKLDTVVTSTLVPMVVKYLTDQSDQVRKTSQAALLVLLEQELVTHADVYDQVCPVILDLTEPDAVDDFKTEAVALMSKMAPLVGREMTERLFVERFTRLCSDTLFQVRKVCAANFGDFSGVVGTIATEAILLPRFVCLCKDGVWGVRKACADVFMVVSCACSLETRKEHLSPVFVSLLSDQSRWVRIAAYQNLGHFISTFADQSASKLQYNEEGKLVLAPPTPPPKSNQTSSKSDFDEVEAIVNKEAVASPDNLRAPTTMKNDMEITEKDIEDAIKIIEGIDFSLDSGGSIKKNQAFKNFQIEEINKNALENNEPHEPPPLPLISRKDDPQFNELNYWRIPLPQICLDFDLIKTETNAVHTTFIQPLSIKEDQDSECRKSSSDDEIQAELEALTAAIAQTYLSDTEKQISENITSEGSSQINMPLSTTNNTAEVPSSEAADLIIPVAKDLHQAEEEKKLTYAEICSFIKKPSRTETIETPKPKDELVSSAPNFREGVDVELKNFSSNLASKDSTSSSSDDDDDEDTIVFHATDSSSSFQHSDICIEPRSNTQSNPDVFSFIDHLSSFNLGDLASGFIDNNKIRARDSHMAILSTLNINQDIVPNTLLEHYISMTDPLQAETVDNEITRHCAYSLPAVALTLGRAYWPVLKTTYETLAGDMHWKVRRTLAFSIHELAFILGEELAQKDLLPVFEGFIKDLDEVRIGVLKHLSHFLKLLSQSHRNLFLPRLNEFLNPDNAHNWRFRLELALQLAPISDLFSPEECYKFICPITFALMADKVMQIRKTCFGVVSHLARHLMSENEETYILPFSRKLEEKFAQAPTWTKRQSYVYVVGQIIWDNSLPLPVVNSLFLSKFLELSRDKVPNIRLAIAKIINSTILTKEYFNTEKNDATHKVEDALDKLKNDCDRDVRYFAFNPIGSEVLFEIID